MADGQVTRGSEIVKPNVKKVRRLCDGKVVGGFAGTSDAAPYGLLCCTPVCVVVCLRRVQVKPLYVCLPWLGAGATADAFTLFEKLEIQLDTHSGMVYAAAGSCSAFSLCSKELAAPIVLHSRLLLCLMMYACRTADQSCSGACQGLAN